MLTISFGERSVRTMTFGFGFCLVLYGVRFSSGSCTLFLISGSVRSCGVRVLSHL